MRYPGKINHEDETCNVGKLQALKSILEIDTDAILSASGLSNPRKMEVSSRTGVRR